LITHPETATALGDHRYDGRSGDFSLRGIAADRCIAQLVDGRRCAFPPCKIDDASPIRIIDGRAFFICN